MSAVASDPAQSRRPWFVLLGAAGWLGATALSLNGCGTDDTGLGTTSPGCNTASECGVTQTCLDRRCVETAVPGQISVDITPVGGSGFLRTQLVDVPFDGQTLTLSLVRPTPYDIQVLDGRQNPISASVSLLESNGIPGRELVTRQFVTAAAPLRLGLLEGSYGVTVQPANGPGLEVLDFSVRFQPETVTKIFQLPEQFRRLSGTVTSVRSNQVRLAGVRVRAFGAQSGLASTTTVTDVSGDFEILLPDTEETFFRVQADQPSSLQPAWSFRRILRVEQNADRVQSIALQLVNADDQGTVRLQVVGIDRDGVPQTVSDALVTLTATVTTSDAPPSFQVSGRTDREGLVRVSGRADDDIPLIRARYLVDVQPPPGSEFSRTSTAINLSRAGQRFSLDEQVSLPRRTEVIGTLRSAGNRVLPEALVSFWPDEPNVMPTEVITTRDGQFIALVDPGQYVMVVEPLDMGVDGEPIPVTAKVVTVQTRALQDLEIVRLPPGRVVRGTVLGSGTPDQIPESGARLVFFTRVNGVTVRLGEAESDDDGGFEIVLGRSIP